MTAHSHPLYRYEPQENLTSCWATQPQTSAPWHEKSQKGLGVLDHWQTDPRWHLWMHPVCWGLVWEKGGGGSARTPWRGTARWELGYQALHGARSKTGSFKNEHLERMHASEKPGKQKCCTLCLLITLKIRMTYNHFLLLSLNRAKYSFFAMHYTSNDFWKKTWSLVTRP